MNIEGILESAILVKMPFLLTVYEGACDWQQREITAIPTIRPTGSLRIALGERCCMAPLALKSASHFEICGQMRRKPT